MKIGQFVGALCILGSTASAAVASGDAARTLDPLTLTLAQRQMAMNAPLGDHGPFGEPADPGCYWSRMSTPTSQGVRWLLEEECSDLGTQAPY